MFRKVKVTRDGNVLTVLCLETGMEGRVQKLDDGFRFLDVTTEDERKRDAWLAREGKHDDAVYVGKDTTVSDVHRWLSEAVRAD